MGTFRTEIRGIHPEIRTHEPPTGGLLAGGCRFILCSVAYHRPKFNTPVL